MEICFIFMLTGRWLADSRRYTNSSPCHVSSWLLVWPEEWYEADLSVCILWSNGSSMCLIYDYRSLVVPELQPFDLKLTGMVDHIFYSFNVMGLTHFNVVTKMLIYGWFVVQIVMAFSIAVFCSRMDWRLPLLWLSCAVLTCLPALSIERVNLLFFPLTFTALLFCSILEGLASLSFFYRLFAIMALLWGISGGFYFSYVNQQAFHPYSLSVLKRNGQFVYGILSHATVPQERREMVVKQLAVLGIHSEHDVNTLLPQMASQALADKRYLPSDSVPFVPRLDMFEP
jgi:hypothetical protein